MGERRECPPIISACWIGSALPDDSNNKKGAMGALPPETFDVNLQNFNIGLEYELLCLTMGCCGYRDCN